MEQTASFDIPVALFLFRRLDTTLRIIDVLRTISPETVLLISDEGRNEEECNDVHRVRSAVEKAIDWPCHVIKRYADSNVGVYRNIAGGAKWAFERYDKVIFLEDDNLPEETFFGFCKEMLEKYQDDSNVFWVCGTNYTGQTTLSDGESYTFTQHVLPCGWASWSKKFLEYYDDDFELFKDREGRKRIRTSCSTERYFKQLAFDMEQEIRMRQEMGEYASWDYQLSSTLRGNGLYGIVPHKNQIRNIGVDEYSEHGGTSFDDVMTQRFCGMNSYPLSFPLVHPDFGVNDELEAELEKIILRPRKKRAREYASRLARRLLKIDRHDKLRLRNSQLLNKKTACKHP